MLIATVFVSATIVFLSRVESNKATHQAEIEKDVLVLSNPFDKIEIEGKSAYIVDTKTGEVIYEKNAEVQLPLASLTKLMTAVVISEQPDKKIAIKANALLHEGDTGLILGEMWDRNSLLSLVLVSSSNDGASAIAQSIGEDTFVNKMNEKAQKLGMAQTYFLNESGLDVSNEKVGGSNGSAKDVAKLITYAFTQIPDVLAETAYPDTSVHSEDGTRHTVENTNDIVENLPFVMASKTGFTDLAGGNLAILFDVGLAHPVAIVVMGSSMDGRFTDVEKLTRTTFEYFESYK
jgi:D-alanyl-D-alanine endopeptidase (penicillin-binding protein 7)